MRRLLQRFIRYLAFKHGKARWAYSRFCNPGGMEYADFLRRHGNFYAIGEECFISPCATIDDPRYIRIGNNVRVAECTLLGHDGSVNMINRARGLRLDNVGKIDIRDNVYLGHNCVILPNVTIGPNAIVTAGSVVRSDVKEGDVVAGVPARPVGRFDMSVEILKARCRNWPWMSLIEQRASDFDPALEDKLVQLRVAYFYEDESRPRVEPVV